MQSASSSAILVSNMEGDPSPNPPMPSLGPIRSNKPSFWRRHRTLIIVLVIIILAGGGLLAYLLLKPGPHTVNEASSAAKLRSVTNQNHWKGSLDSTAIPLGDGKVSTTPKPGYVDSCTTKFRGGGAEHAGGWINSADGTWNSKTKVTVQGSVTWPAAEHGEKISGSTRVVTTNDLPKGYTTGVFPISRSDPAYKYDRNPNDIGTQALTYELPLNPTAAATPNCTSLGPIGILSNGVVLFNGLDAAGRDAVAHETQDSCNGHPDGKDIYHYHDIPICLREGSKGEATLVGYALDGYGIYVERDAKGNLPTNADLDECHGRVSQVAWNGKKISIYHYSATLEYPYAIGCFHGAPVSGPSHAGAPQ